MDRKNFIKKSFLGAAGLAAAGSGLKGRRLNAESSTYDKLMQQVGFNHLPNNERKTMKTVLHKANTRGRADHGWLDSRHTFSFANYHNPDRMHFGVLRVLNDDRVASGKGFGTHPHDNMEIISIPLEGDLQHQDSMGNTAVIKKGDVQVMSAGSGITHSEYNKNKDQEVKFLQIWVFPNEKNVQPRYDQISLSDIALENEFYQIISPNKSDQGVWIHQNAWFHMGEFTQPVSTRYSLKKEGNGIYAFVLNGEFVIDDQTLNERDGLGIWDTKEINIKATSGSKLLLMEIPMNL
jgi:redox-sensitive bicupin YhaK (pirin superfamily)